MAAPKIATASSGLTFYFLNDDELYGPTERYKALVLNKDAEKEKHTLLSFDEFLEGTLSFPRLVDRLATLGENPRGLLNLLFERAGSSNTTSKALKRAEGIFTDLNIPFRDVSDRLRETTGMELPPWAMFLSWWVKGVPFFSKSLVDAVKDVTSKQLRESSETSSKTVVDAVAKVLAAAPFTVDPMILGWLQVAIASAGLPTSVLDRIPTCVMKGDLTEVALAARLVGPFWTNENVQTLAYILTGSEVYVETRNLKVRGKTPQVGCSMWLKAEIESGKNKLLAAVGIKVSAHSPGVMTASDALRSLLEPAVNAEDLLALQHNLQHNEHSRHNIVQALHDDASSRSHARNKRSEKPAQIERVMGAGWGQAVLDVVNKIGVPNDLDTPFFSSPDCKLDDESALKFVRTTLQRNGSTDTAAIGMQSPRHNVAFHAVQEGGVAGAKAILGHKTDEVQNNYIGGAGNAAATASMIAKRVAGLAPHAVADEGGQYKLGAEAGSKAHPDAATGKESFRILNLKGARELTEDEERHLLSPTAFNDVCSTTTASVMRALMRFLLTTGCRPGEAWRIKHSDVYRISKDKTVNVYKVILTVVTKLSAGEFGSSFESASSRASLRAIVAERDKAALAYAAEFLADGEEGHESVAGGSVTTLGFEHLLLLVQHELHRRNGVRGDWTSLVKKPLLRGWNPTSLERVARISLGLHQRPVAALERILGANKDKVVRGDAKTILNMVCGPLSSDEARPSAAAEAGTGEHAASRDGDDADGHEGSIYFKRVDEDLVDSFKRNNSMPFKISYDFPPSIETLDWARRVLCEHLVGTASSASDAARMDYIYHGSSSSNQGERVRKRVDWTPLEKWFLLQYHLDKGRGEWEKCLAAGAGFFHPNRTACGLKEHWHLHFEIGPCTSAEAQAALVSAIVLWRSEAVAWLQDLLQRAERAQRFNDISALASAGKKTTTAAGQSRGSAVRSRDPASAAEGMRVPLDEASQMELQTVTHMLHESQTWNWLDGSMKQSDGWTNTQARGEIFGEIDRLLKVHNYDPERVFRAVIVSRSCLPHGVTEANVRWAARTAVYNHFKAQYKRITGSAFSAASAPAAASASRLGAVVGIQRRRTEEMGEDNSTGSPPASSWAAWKAAAVGFQRRRPEHPGEDEQARTRRRLMSTEEEVEDEEGGHASASEPVAFPQRSRGEVGRAAAVAGRGMESTAAAVDDAEDVVEDIAEVLEEEIDGFP